MPLKPTPRLAELPPAPAGRTGWPWTEESPLYSPSTRVIGVSLIIPTFQGGETLEGALRSALLQGYPALEVHVVDGGSQDRTHEILARYRPWLASATSEKDRGQSDAINKGLRACSGDLVNWLNADDLLCPGAIAAVARAVQEGDLPDLVAGACRIFDLDSRKTLRVMLARPPATVLDFARSNAFELAQPSTFVRRALFQELGGVREDLQCVMDWDLYLRMVVTRRASLRTRALAEVLSELSDHPDTKTRRLSRRFREEGIQVLKALLPRLATAERTALRAWIRELETQDAVTRVQDAHGGLGSLLREAVHRPTLMTSRFFWGAIRRAL